MMNSSCGASINVPRIPLMQQCTNTVNNINNNNNNNNNRNVNKKNSSCNMNLHVLKIQQTDLNESDTQLAADSPTTPTPTPKQKKTTAQLNCSPPDFDFNLPCRYFKSTFARSLSLTNHNQCKSLDFDVNNYRSHQQHIINNNNNNNNMNLGYQQRNNATTPAAKSAGPPLPQRMARLSLGVSSNVKNEVNIICCNDAKPPVIPARRSPPAGGGDGGNGGNGIEVQQPKQQQQQQHQSMMVLRNVDNENTAAADTVGNPTSSLCAGNYDKVENHATTQMQQNHKQQQQTKQQLPKHQQHQMVNANIGSNAINDNNSNHNNNSNYRRNGWPRDPVEQDCNHCADEETIPVKESEHETTKMSSTPSDFAAGINASLESRQSFEVPNNTINVEVVFLQNQVDTLQWQLKQVETSCEMYHAVMEEVARFLDRYHNQRQQQRQLQQQQQQNRINMEQISRSKSLYHVNVGGHEKNYTSDSATSSTTATMPTTYLRTRSSTNLIDLKQPLLTKQTTTKAATTKTTKTTGISADDHIYECISSAQSYSAFKDFTLRRSPRKSNDSKSIKTANDAEEKLNQEAFRLSRTIQNLLNTSTQQPDLTQHRNSLAAVSLGRLSKAPSTSVLTLHAPMHNSTSVSKAGAALTSENTLNGGSEPFVSHPTAPKSNALAAEMLFLRSNTMRDSRLSLRSSTDSSVHSTTSSAASSSSKVETDEECIPFHKPNHNTSKQMQQLPLGSTTEDESGFSSINSFQDIGVPLSSTLLSNSSIKGRNLGCKNFDSDTNSSEANSLHEFNVDSRNSTLKAMTVATTETTTSTVSSATHPTNVLGVPVQGTHHDQQYRWDLASKTYRNTNKFQRFSTLSNEDSTTVLWV